MVPRHTGSKKVCLCLPRIRCDLSCQWLAHLRWLAFVARTHLPLWHYVSWKFESPGNLRKSSDVWSFIYACGDGKPKYHIFTSKLVANGCSILKQQLSAPFPILLLTINLPWDSKTITISTQSIGFTGKILTRNQSYFPCL